MPETQQESVSSNENGAAFVQVGAPVPPSEWEADSLASFLVAWEEDCPAVVRPVMLAAAARLRALAAPRPAAAPEPEGDALPTPLVALIASEIEDAIAAHDSGEQQTGARILARAQSVAASVQSAPEPEALVERFEKIHAVIARRRYFSIQPAAEEQAEYDAARAALLAAIRGAR